MKSFVLLLLAAFPAFAQHPPASPPACGPTGVTFSTQDDPSAAAPAPPGSDKAQVFFIQDDGTGGDRQHYTIVLGIDGKWVGAYKHNAWFAVAVDPGEHHVCASVQSQSAFGKTVALAHFNAEAGKVYYFRTQFPAGLTSLYPTYPYLTLDRPDSDEAQYLIGISPVSKAQPTK